MRASIIALVLGAAISATVVAGIYEVRLRRTRGSASSSDLANDGDQAAVDQRMALRLPRESCAELKRRYQKACPNAETLPASDGTATGAAPAPVAPTPDELAEIAAGERWVKPERAELLELARRCELHLDTPDVLGTEPRVIDVREAEALAVSTHERAALDAVLGELHAEFTRSVGQIFDEIKGGGTRPGDVPPLVMIDEIENFAPDEIALARAKLARERAGMPASAPPRATPSPAERLLRHWSGLGEAFERRLAARLGPERAHQLRFLSKGAPWMRRSALSGCPPP